MIAEITGKIKKKKELSLLLDVHGISYEVMIPPAIMQTIDPSVSPDGTVTLMTYHYYQMDPSRAVPILIGFANEIEREFFERFITVSGVGPKAACRALALPFSVIADAIDRGDMALLKTLPGIGEQKLRVVLGIHHDRHGNLPFVRQALGLAGFLPRFGKHREENCGQDGDDRDHDQQFD